jgi:nicotinate-nucleotide--dimethylbenzimidazole phosphoribosyltransferase
MVPAQKVESTLARIRPIDAAWISRAEARQLQLTKPPGSLGRLEEIANRLCAIQRTLTPRIDQPRIVVFAGDHGVCQEGVNPYPQEVTAQMVRNFLAGGAAINALARVAAAELVVVDTGVVSELERASQLVSRRIAAGTRNFCVEPAMSLDEAVAALSIGIDCAEEAVRDGCTLLGLGEMGIGNTTAASAITVALTGLPAEMVCGRGTGSDDAALMRKIDAVKRAIALHRPFTADRMELLARLGGFEIAAMCGLCLGSAALQCAVIVDGFISTAAAAVAVRLCPAVGDYLFAAHRSTEPGHAPLIAILGQAPLFDLSMRLGEGTGAALAIPVFRAAAEAFTNMATFTSAGVSDASGA